MDPELIKMLLRVVATYDLCYELYWDTDLQFCINCNDVFFWGCADAEDVETEEDIKLLEKCLSETETDGMILYCARRRKMRPQGAIYKGIEEKNWPLFNECGPEREIGLGNPNKIGDK